MPDPAHRLTRIIERARDRGERVLVLGLGNEMLGDDGVGVLIARDLAALDDERFLSVPVEIGVENAGHLVRRHCPDVLLVFDAVAASTRRPWLFVPTSRLDTWCHSTHSVPLSLLIRTWQQDAPRMRPYFVGVRPLLVALGAPMSREAQAAREEIVALVRSAATR
ncbi:MAG: hydrogenase maturation protease [Thermoanaerobaculaceae bacterium]